MHYYTRQQDALRGHGLHAWLTQRCTSRASRLVRCFTYHNIGRMCVTGGLACLDADRGLDWLLVRLGLTHTVSPSPPLILSHAAECFRSDRRKTIRIVWATARHTDDSTTENGHSPWVQGYMVADERLTRRERWKRAGSTHIPEEKETNVSTPEACAHTTIHTI